MPSVVFCACVSPLLCFLLCGSGPRARRTFPVGMQVEVNAQPTASDVELDASEWSRNCHNPRCPRFEALRRLQYSQQSMAATRLHRSPHRSVYLVSILFARVEHHFNLEIQRTPSMETDAATRAAMASSLLPCSLYQFLTLSALPAQPLGGDFVMAAAPATSRSPPPDTSSVRCMPSRPECRSESDRQS
jgi:hypothetical protein